MFLHQLNTEEKEQFLELAWSVLAIDGELRPAEQDLLETYKVECNLEDYMVAGQNPREVVATLRNAPKQSKRVILAELLAIMMSEEEFSRPERNLMSMVVREWSFPERSYKQLRRWAKEFVGVVEEGQFLILQ